MQANGYCLARGDRRGFVALDPAGEAHSINKKLTDLVAAEVRERLADIDVDRLPSVAEARAAQRQCRQVLASVALAPEPVAVASVPPGPLVAVQPVQPQQAPLSRPYERLLRIVTVAIRAVEAVAEAVGALFDSRPGRTPPQKLAQLLGSIPVQANKPEV